LTDIVASPEDGELWDLENLAAATGLCDWMFDQFARLVHGYVLEIGAGIGTFSQRLLDAGATGALLIEPEADCMAFLERRFSADERVELSTDLLPDSAALQGRPEAFDFALCQNVLEHIPDDGAALAAVVDALKPGGGVGILVPAHPMLFGRLDEKYEHQRRYTRDSLQALLRSAGLAVEEIRFFNLLGVPGWWVKSRFGTPGIDSRSLRAYELLLRPWRPLEGILRPPAGLSLVALASKPA
jgi:SAM-dependent methyltransferase